LHAALEIYVVGVRAVSAKMTLQVFADDLASEKTLIAQMLTYVLSA